MRPGGGVDARCASGCAGLLAVLAVVAPAEVGWLADAGHDDLARYSRKFRDRGDSKRLTWEQLPPARLAEAGRNYRRDGSPGNTQRFGAGRLGTDLGGLA